ncbi:MAG TPA: HAMP domain-containing sensor histidine kinase [Nocardioides sp.]|nr:HAMP domain-containing sensor histidine kinase [Nocardioides sp.]
MRRQLIVTVAAVVSMVLLAMLVPMAVLVRSYALEDRLSRAALEVQATETVVSGQDKGDVSVYVDEINAADDGTQTTVLYADGTGIGPNPGEDDRVSEARRTGQARVDDVGGGAQILVPVSLGGSTGQPRETPVIRVDVQAPGLASGVGRAWLLLATLGVALLAGALVLADRLGRSFVRPLADLADRARALGTADAAGVPAQVSGPPEVRDLAEALNRLVARVEVLLERERQSVADLSHRLRTPMTALRLRVEGVADPAERERLAADLDELQGMVDHVVREARRSEREGLVAGTDALAVLAERAEFWRPLAEDQDRVLRVAVTGTGPARVRASAADLVAVLDALMDNVFTHTDDGVAVRVSLTPRDEGGLVLVVEDDGPGYPDDLDVTRRGTSGAGSTGLGMSIVAATAAESGGRLVLGRTSTGGASAEVTLGPPV